MRTSDRLLHALKAAGPQTAAGLAQKLGVTAVAVRQMLERLKAEGLVGHDDRRAGVGRPRRFWQLTAAGNGRFPDNHAGLTLELIEATRAVFGDDGLELLIAHREAKALAAYQSGLATLPRLADKVARLAELRSAEGYMAAATVEADGSLLLVENHCPICVAATRCQSFCRSELAIFKAALGAGIEVTRLDHIAQGARRCAYRIAAAPP